MHAIEEDESNEHCRFRAHVWFPHHSHQCGCFTTRQAAHQWAVWLHREIVTEVLLKSGHMPE